MYHINNVVLVVLGKSLRNTSVSSKGVRSITNTTRGIAGNRWSKVAWIVAC